MMLNPALVILILLNTFIIGTALTSSQALVLTVQIW